MAAQRHEAILVDDEENYVPLPMTDREHQAAFGWAWDDPNTVEDVA